MSAVVSAFPVRDDFEDNLGPSTLLQIHIIEQITPILKVRALRRLLELHDVAYAESDEAKQLRRHLTGFMKRLLTRKRVEGTHTVPGTLVPAYLKEPLLKNFNLDISGEILVNRALLRTKDSLETDPETEELVLAVCLGCRRDLNAGRVPALGTANFNYHGPVPPQLENLMVVEEAMIALCRENVAFGAILFSILNDPPLLPKLSRRPLQTSSHQFASSFPLIVRKEKIANALAWLKEHNRLYRKVMIDDAVLESLPTESMLPFHIQHIVPDAGIDSATSDYVPGSHLPEAAPASEDSQASTVGASSAPRLSEILPPTPPVIPFQSVVFADVDGNAPSVELRATALKHMKTAGSNYIEIPHDLKPANEL
ncbi:hypothetical protein B0H17DRAFT_1217281 [Mycena rosella]|uniref:DUF6570 domain-containing protein n=1 Tax=Mycena rosella TaxID=1033263 RepID=A0AAD7C0R1_MYCRO|nr:hypothetical protein B0H17DRAFT_1217281 [Mycena rosella]